MERKLRSIKIAVIISIMLSLLSFFTIQKGWGEIYPFYSWKLFSQPTGWDDNLHQYRLYVWNEEKKVYNRMDVRSSPYFNQDEYPYTINFIINDSLIDANVRKARLLAFAKHYAPKATRYAYVKEHITRSNLLSHMWKYQKTILYTFENN